ncbi:MAG: acylphosphatase [Planctomycetota bacterium]
MPATRPHSTALERRTVWFRGDVQGVGFRATTQRLAGGLALTGTVRNLADGGVELVVEGTVPEIDRLIAGLREHFGSEAFDHEQQVAEATGSFTGFRIRH